MSYEAFLEAKALKAPMRGMETVPDISAHLFPFQREAVAFGLRVGSWACFLDTGLGKTLCELEWCRHAAEASNGKALILTPLAVARQIEAEGQRFGYDVRVIRSMDDVGDGINVCNYDRLHLLDPQAFGAVALDEASILKSFDGKVSRSLIEAFAGYRWRMVATATPAPNDPTELAQYAEFCGVSTRSEMLVRFFINDAGDTKCWRLKGHAVRPFFDWMATWSRMARHPRDLGDDIAGYDLPPLQMFRHRAVEPDDMPMDGSLFGGAVSATDLHDVKRRTIRARLDVVAGLVAAEPDRHFIVWGDTNYETEAVTKRIPGAVEVQGSDAVEWKESVAEWFVYGKCLCSTSSNRAKLAKWQSAQKVTGSGITPSIESNDSPSPLSISGSTGLSGSPTCSTTTLPTERNGSSLENSATSATPTGEPNTLLAKKHERPQSPALETGKPETQTSDSRNDSSLTGSLLNDTEPCSQRSAASALSAKSDQSPTRQVADSPSTTATRRRSSEACSAPTATGASASSQTGQIFSIEPSCICGCKGRRVLVTKPSLFGQGLNFQICNRMAFVGRSFSYESWYQAVRRCWRFGQQSPVHVHLVVAEGEDAIGRVIDRKADDHADLQREMVAAMTRAIGDETKRQNVYNPTFDGRFYGLPVQCLNEAHGHAFSLFHGDCVSVAKQLPDETIGFSVYSPPFSNLFVYSDSSADMGNAANDGEFLEHYGFLLRELYRLTKPGRLTAVHCSDLPLQKWKDGVVGIKDLSGDIIKAHEAAGWTLHSRITIWKSPVVEMTRTKALGLLYKQLQKDSGRSRTGMADYLLVFRKDGDNAEPIRHTPEEFSLDQWQEWASPVWMTVRQTRTLNVESARDDKDERHLCPLQLDVIERALTMWSNAGDLVMSPFTGIGSEGVASMKMGRRFVGTELKQSYFAQAVQFLQAADRQQSLLEVGA